MRFCILAIALMGLAMVTIPAVAQQRGGNPFAAERAIFRLPAVGVDAEIDKARCGDWLLYFANPDVTPPGPRIAYIVESQPGIPKDASVVFAFLKEKFRVVRDDSKKIPTAQADIAGGDKRITIRMSGRDIARSPCLR